MGIGHVAVGLGLKSADRRLNVGFLIFATLFADFLLGWFTLAGWESYEVPPDYASKHYLLFTFPWSHGLLPDLGWAAGLGVVTAILLRSLRAGVIVILAVLSHYLLDGIVHVKGLPVSGPGSPEFGLGLWQNLPAALTLEVVMAAVGLAIYLVAERKESRARRLGIAAYTSVLSMLLVAGQATATQVPERETMIASWIGAPLLFGAIAFWLDRR